MKRVLIVDDQNEIAVIVKRYLQSKGYAADVASSAKEALRTAASHAPDVVITDIYMPDQDGIELIRTIRAKLPNVKLIAVSGGSLGHFDALQVARLMGADEALYKPFDFSTLLQTVQRLIGAPSAEGGSTPHS